MGMFLSGASDIYGDEAERWHLVSLERKQYNRGIQIEIQNSRERNRAKERERER